ATSFASHGSVLMETPHSAMQGTAQCDAGRGIVLNEGGHTPVRRTADTEAFRISTLSATALRLLDPERVRGAAPRRSGRTGGHSGTAERSAKNRTEPEVIAGPGVADTMAVGAP